MATDFIDKVVLNIKAGDGGDGIVSFIHYKGIPNGGPDGGDGGKGGDVVFVGDRHLTTLADYYYRKKLVAENGSRGEPKNCYGKAGQDLIVKVPLGTVIRDAETGGVIADVTYDGERKTVLVGGEGGRGNAKFTNSRRHAPHFSQTGEKTEIKRIVMELKTIADVGLVGFPNAGKSTILSKITKARPKIANYPFTTLSPNLGIVERYDKRFVVADIPGLIEGASEGAGLGHEFLRHVERTRLLIHVVDVSATDGRDPVSDYKQINAELKNYSKKLAALKQIVVLNKCDMYNAEENVKEFRKKVRGKKIFTVSAITNEGLDAVVEEAFALLKDIPETEKETETFKYEKPEFLTYEIYYDDDRKAYVIEGTLVAVLCRNVVLNDTGSLHYMHKVLKTRGVYNELKKMGAVDGDTVIMNDIEFELMY